MKGLGVMRRTSIFILRTIAAYQGNNMIRFVFLDDHGLWRKEWIGRECWSTGYCNSAGKHMGGGYGDGEKTQTSNPNLKITMSEHIFVFN